MDKTKLVQLVLFSIALFSCNSNSNENVKTKKVINLIENYTLYSSGTRVGVVTKVSRDEDFNLKYKGVLTMNLTLVIENKNIPSSEQFIFYLDSENLKNIIEENLNKIVQVKYKQYRNGEEDFFLVVAVEKIN